MDTTLLNGLIFMCFGLMLIGALTKLRMFNLFTLPILLYLAGSYYATSPLIGMAFVTIMVGNVYYAFWGGKYV